MIRVLLYVIMLFIVASPIQVGSTAFFVSEKIEMLPVTEEEILVETELDADEIDVPKPIQDIEHRVSLTKEPELKISPQNDREQEVPNVPFYSQFTDISSPGWQKVGCGIASTAMLIDYYVDTDIESVDSLLNRGISSAAYLDNAGWIHSGLINLSAKYGLDGQSHSLAHLSKEAALVELEKVLSEGPVMASVHYTFEPTNPIPHLVVINGVSGDQVFYNDPAEESGGGSLSKDKFLKAWKKRYISIRPA